jgi:hypothetical protein
MALDKAKAFLKELAKDKALQTKMAGFTLEELKQAGEEMKKKGELSDKDLSNIAGGGSYKVTWSIFYSFI